MTQQDLDWLHFFPSLFAKVEGWAEGHTCSVPQLDRGAGRPPNPAAHVRKRCRGMLVLLARPDQARKDSSTVLLSWMSDCLSETAKKIFSVSLFHMPFKATFHRLNHLESLLEFKNSDLQKRHHLTCLRLILVTK